MKIDDKTLNKLAELAKIEIKDSERDKVKSDMTAILDWVEKLDELDTETTQPITQMTRESNKFREDSGHRNISTDKALKNASEKMNGYFVVPKVIKKKNE